MVQSIPVHVYPELVERMLLGQSRSAMAKFKFQLRNLSSIMAELGHCWIDGCRMGGVQCVTGYGESLCSSVSNCAFDLGTD